jgi:hypothetical protein
MDSLATKLLREKVSPFIGWFVQQPDVDVSQLTKH